jgi:hypothetical protein
MSHLLTFVETSVFSKQISELGNDSVLKDLQEALLQSPERGALIQGTGGLRKIRISLGGKGKRGGGRVIYLYLQIRSRIYLVYAYSKGELDDLSPDDKKRLKICVDQIKKEVEL